MKDGGPAFPITLDNYDRNVSHGMTLRDYFAAHASEEDIKAHTNTNIYHTTKREVARYSYADAMLKERAR